ncbi:DUF2254 domain-containing protein [Virgibacillus sp. C22-A2]|uniref:DUF2254 domain-containing protein n=1 Tax=Virgibacillus tibetensis TaxID=3042313 RepID=A0ABU6KF55_9BACI|nr:DUF2254 domain-containing protein [Virgibacillus sp. C22-A2]
MFVKFLPPSIQKYFLMGKRQRHHELQLTLWRAPLLYIIVAFFLVALTLFLDVGLELAQYTTNYFEAEFETTRLLISALIGGILTLSAFTLNSLLVVLTTFSGQFSPRLLQNFVKDKQTQHVLGIFNGSFVYVLIMFLFISSHPVEYYVAVPFATVTVAFITALTFIYFINHATAWMQVHNITDTMKSVSREIITGSLKQDLEAFRTEEPGDLMEEYRKRIKIVKAPVSGYIQLINFYKIIEEAKNDNILLKLESRIGSFTLEDNILFSYWGPGADNVDADKYVRMVQMGHKETEIQDLRFALNKLGEIAIKAIGSNDPKTASNTINQLTDLLLIIDKNITFTPYLADEDRQVRLIIGIDNFEFHLYQSYGLIRHYAQKNYPIITVIIGSLGRLAQSVNPVHYEVIWQFARNTIDSIYTEFIFDLDRDLLLSRLRDLAQTTGHTEEYAQIENHLRNSKI